MDKAVSKLLKEYPKVDCIFDAYTLEELYVSGRVLKALGLSKKDVVGRYFFEGCPEEGDIKQQQEVLYRMVAKGKPVELNARRQGNGKILDIALRAQLEYVGEGPYVICFVREWKTV